MSFTPRHDLAFVIRKNIYQWQFPDNLTFVELYIGLVSKKFKFRRESD